MWHTHTQTYTQWNYYSAMRKEDILPFATTWMDLEPIILSDISHREKDKCCMVSPIGRILKSQTLKPENKMVFTQG